MKARTKMMILAAVVAAGIALFFAFKGGQSKPPRMSEVEAQTADLKSVIAITGVVEPMNRLEVRPPMAGRIEAMLVKEGDYLREGETAALLSSTERAALLDMAKSKGAEEVKKWEALYKPIPITAPIAGTVIVRKVEPGQSISQSEAVIVISDRLIIRAQADETDISRIKKGAAASVTLDAFQGKKVRGRVEHISFESRVISNVTVYEVLVVTGNVPDYFRSGMSAGVEITEKEAHGVVVVPAAAVKTERKSSYVLVRKNGSQEKIQVETGITENGMTEIKSGLSAGDRVLVQPGQQAANRGRNQGTSPFVPQRRAR